MNMPATSVKYPHSNLWVAGFTRPPTVMVPSWSTGRRVIPRIVQNAMMTVSIQYSINSWKVSHCQYRIP